MMRKIHLIAAGLIGLILPDLSPAPTHAMPGSGAFAPASDIAFVPVADLNAAWEERRRWRYSQRRSPPAWRPSQHYYQSDAHYPAYRHGGYAAYDCCQAYAAYPVDDRAHYYSNLGRYYHQEYPRFFLHGFYNGRDSTNSW